MLVLPRNLASLTKATAQETARYALSAVRLVDKGDCKYLAEATDGRILVRIEGTGDLPERFPAMPALATAPNSATETLIPAEDWTRAFSKIPKARKRGGPQTLTTACVLGDKVTTFGAVDAGTHTVTEAIKPDARYPRTDEVFPKEAPIVTVALDPVLLAKVCDLAAGILDDKDTRRVFIDIVTPEKPIKVRTVSVENSQTFTALIVPLTLGKNEKAQQPATVTLTQADYDALEERISRADQDRRTAEDNAREATADRYRALVERDEARQQLRELKRENAVTVAAVTME